MQRKDLAKQKLPDTPGVYFFCGVGKKILYIGKATSLRDRVKSYFARNISEVRGPAIAKMVTKTKSVGVQKTDSVLEALILEANLIKKHKPPYNVRERDDKSFNYVVVTAEEYPRVMIVRGKDLAVQYPPRLRKHVFGPFPSGYIFKEAMRLIRKLFPYYDTAQPVSKMAGMVRQGKLRFNRSIGLYPPEGVTKREYGRTIQHIRLFFEGKKSQLLKRLEREMHAYARRQEFERAQNLKRVIFGLTHIQDISLLRREVRELSSSHTYRIEAYDIAHTSGTSSVGVMVVVEDGEAKKGDYRKFRIRQAVAGSDTDALSEVLRRRLRHEEWLLPNLIVVDGGRAQINAARRVLTEFHYRIPVVSVVKNERHRPEQVLDVRKDRGHEDEILLANSEAHRFALRYHRKLRQHS